MVSKPKLSRNPQPLLCPNNDCPLIGLQNAGNVRVHESLRQCWRCTTGTLLHGKKYPKETIVMVVTLPCMGLPPPQVPTDEVYVKLQKRLVACMAMALLPEECKISTADIERLNATFRLRKPTFGGVKCTLPKGYRLSSERPRDLYTPLSPSK